MDSDQDKPFENTIQWYPGHIAKYERKLKETLKLVDIVIEVLDARIPVSTTNQRLQESIRHKPKLIVLNKSDLSDPNFNTLWKKRFETVDLLEQQVLLYSGKLSNQKHQELVRAIVQLGEAVQEKMVARGRKPRPLRTLIAGMPNVGKSTIINSIVKQKKSKTGHQAGVTRTTQWIRVHPQIELLDSPGIIPPQLETQQMGLLLAVANCVGENAFDDETIARFLVDRIQDLYPGQLNRYFSLPDLSVVTLEAIADSRNYKQPGGFSDSLRAAQAVLHDFRHGKMGRLTLEHDFSVLAGKPS
jgi:ribosome biogenesis GTPase A